MAGWFLVIKKGDETMSTRQYIGARYVPKFFDWDGSPEWRSGVAYEALTIVTRNGNSYTSKIPVPSNITAPENNPTYWAATGLYNEQVESIRQGLLDAQGNITDLDRRLDTAEGDIDSLETAVQNLITKSKRILVVGGNSEYTTINSAITAARELITSIGGRVTIIVLSGEYNEQIVLRPNPGIDFIGYGARIKGNFSYPNCCVYLSGTTTMVGFYIENGYSEDTNAYALHVERDGSNTTGKMMFIDCDFVCINGSGAGVGMTHNSEVQFRNCRFYTGSALEDRGALYLHNSQASNEALQTIYLVNCFFESGWNDLRIDDACNIAGNSNSPLRLLVFNCGGRQNRVRFFNTSYNTAQASHDTPGPNITLIGNGNGILALNPNRVKVQELYAATKGSYALFPLAYNKNDCVPTITFPGESNIEAFSVSSDSSGGAHSTAGAFTENPSVKITYNLK